MSFMKPEIISQTVWILETNFGTETVLTDVQDFNELLLDEDDDDNKRMLTETFSDFIEGNEVYSGERKDVWTYRLSAPGYLDATDMGTAETEEEAIRSLLETYGGQSEELEDWERELVDELIAMTDDETEIAKIRNDYLGE